MKKYLPLACAPLCLAALSACSILQPPDVGPQDNIVVSSSEPPTFEAKDVEVREVTENLAEPVKDEGLNVEYELQGLYSGGGGTVLTVKIHNLGELPLPVDAHLAYDAPDGSTLNTPDSVHIPAKGSITVSMTADLPSDADRTSLRLWLATTSVPTNPEGHLISDPIDITVQTRAGIVSVYGAGIAAALVLALAALFRLGKRKKKNTHG